MSSTLVSIRQALLGLHQKESQLAEYILEHPLEATRMSIVELSEHSGTSTATVSRFCKSFHFQSYADFKIKLAAELANSGSVPSTYQDIVAGTGISELVAAVKQNHIRSIEETSLLLDFTTLEQVVGILLHARQIDIYGVATSGVVASDFYQKLVRLGRRVSMFTDSHMQITSASSLTREDAVIAVSYSGETPEIIDAVSCARDKGALVISLTRHGPSTLAAASDLQLFTSSLEEGVRRGDMASRIAQLFVLDIVFSGMLSRAFEDYTPRLEESYQLVQRYRKSKREGN